MAAVVEEDEAEVLQVEEVAAEVSNIIPISPYLLL